MLITILYDNRNYIKDFSLLIKLLQNLLENIQSPYRFTIIMLESCRFAINH